MAVAKAELRPRVFRERRDVWNDFSDAELVKRYCLDNARCHFKGRNKVNPPEMKVIATLRYLTTGKMQQ